MTTGPAPLKREKFKDLTKAQAARLAGAIWIYGSIDIKREKARTKSQEKKYYYYPRIALSMPIPLSLDYVNDTGGNAYAGEDGYYSLIIDEPELVKKRLKEILPFMSGEEAKQIEIALEILRIKRSKDLRPTDKQQKLDELYKQWLESHKRLKKWIKEFKAKCEKKPKERVPRKIWTKAYAWEDC